MEPIKTKSFGKQASQEKRTPKGKGLGVLVLGVAVAGAIGFSAMMQTGGNSSGGSTTTQAVRTVGPKFDGIKPSQAQQRQKAFDQVTMAGVSMAPVQDVQQAVTTMTLPAADEAKLQAELKSGELVLKWVEVFDDLAEDGDIVNVSINGFSATVPIMHAPVRFAVPVAAQGGSGLNITGVKDGGGGVTLGIRHSGGVVLSPVLAVGQTISLGIR